jgi:hypothetical protein
MSTIRQKLDALGFTEGEFDQQVHAVLDALTAHRLPETVPSTHASETAVTVPAIAPPLVREIADRCRRIETRLMAYMEAQGFDTQVHRPTWLAPDEVGAAGVIVVPTPSVSLRDCLAIVPDDWDPSRPVVILNKHQNEHLATLILPFAQEGGR